MAKIYNFPTKTFRDITDVVTIASGFMVVLWEIRYTIRHILKKDIEDVNIRVGEMG